MSYSPYSMMHPQHRTTVVSKVPVRESYAPTTYETRHAPARLVKVDPRTSVWMPMYWRGIHVIAKAYNPSDDQAIRSVRCFYEALAELMPTETSRRLMRNFIAMSPEVVLVLTESKAMSSFFTVHKSILTNIQQAPGSYFSNALKGPEELFAWTYLLHCYFDLVNGIDLTSFNALKAAYDKNQISKEFWAHAIWFILHFSAYHAPNILGKEWALAYKAFVSCLRYSLPCSICKNNLGANLAEIPIDNYLFTKESIFEYSVALHNIVNKELGKPTLSVAEAVKIYAPFDGQYVRQNVGYSGRVPPRATGLGHP